ncbi:MAG: Hsp20/alpha crystallin family protein [Chthoniobacterales bacterium]|nr:Hsp20/alpha crystallin family protein [Chthoniobacterales bacterium]
METFTRENHVEKSANGQQAAERFVPPVATVRENAEGYTLQIEMPGVNKEGLELWIENNELTVVGRRAQLATAGNLIHRESRRENFRRTFELDPSIDAARIGASIDQGVATLILPKAERVKPRKIAVS